MISVIIPTMNEEEAIGGVLDEIKKVMNEEYEIIVVDNSRDSTPAIAKGRGARVVTEKRRGYGRAYKTGFDHVSGEIIVAMDGDGSYPAYIIPDMVKVLRSENLDFISCERFSKLPEGSMTRTHKVGNWILNLAFLVLYFTKIKDSQSGMWVFKKELLKNLKVQSGGMSFSEELKIEAIKHGKFKEISIVYGEREGEKKLNTFRDGLSNLLFLIKKRFF